MSWPVQNMIVQKGKDGHKTGPLDVPVALYTPEGKTFAPALTGLELTAGPSGAITGGTATLSDGSTIPVTVTSGQRQTQDDQTPEPETRSKAKGKETK